MKRGYKARLQNYDAKRIQYETIMCWNVALSSLLNNQSSTASVPDLLIIHELFTILEIQNRLCACHVSNWPNQCFKWKNMQLITFIWNLLIYNVKYQTFIKPRIIRLPTQIEAWIAQELNKITQDCLPRAKSVTRPILHTSLVSEILTFKYAVKHHPIVMGHTMSKNFSLSAFCHKLFTFACKH